MNVLEIKNVLTITRSSMSQHYSISPSPKIDVSIQLLPLMISKMNVNHVLLTLLGEAPTTVPCQTLKILAKA